MTKGTSHTKEEEARRELHAMKYERPKLTAETSYYPLTLEAKRSGKQAELLISGGR
jgi:hypothetical protein